MWKQILKDVITLGLPRLVKWINEKLGEKEKRDKTPPPPAE